MLRGQSSRNSKRPTVAHDAPSAFTLIELLVVAAITAILAGLLLPALARGKEKAKVVRVHAALRDIGLALDLYSSDNDGKLPPVCVNCNTDLATHWCQLPIELSRNGDLPRSGDAGREANREDIFDPGQTCKSAAPGPQRLNGEPVGNSALWIPECFPEVNSEKGKDFRDPKTTPVRWVIWSLGPKPDSNKSPGAHAPTSGLTWYRRTGDAGVLPGCADREGMHFKSP